MKKSKMRRQQQTQIHDEEEVTQMTITVHIYPNERLFFEIPDDVGDPLADDNPRLSYEEFNAAIQRLSELSIKFDDPDAEPLSDYAMSRESIYEGHPKL